MQAISLTGKRILVTQAHDFMGPALCSALTEFGADVIADTQPVIAADDASKIIGAAGHLDALVLNLGVPAPRTLATAISDAEWRAVFAHMVDPLPRFMRAILPTMIARQHGKILLMGSASALRGMPATASYSAARAAQLGFVQAVGVEVAKHGIQVNAIAQNFVENPTYYPESIRQNPKFQERLQREVPLGRLVTAQEDASFAAYLCSDAANCFVGQVFPVCGGWVAR
jgi:NAD(P)-dependent dehydrogenase (short-subunit alcohol dehydrogenase family)